MKKYLILGIGNIGLEYDGTRHNIGFDIADTLVLKHNGNFSNDRLAMVAHIKIKGKPVVVIKPTTYVNLSGKALKYWIEKENIPKDQILVLVDDLALPIDALRLRGSGSHAGHNGLKDIEAVLGTNKYSRLRFGIGNDYPRGKQVEFVLGKWPKDDLPLIIEKIKTSVDIIESFVSNGLQNTMNTFNHKHA